MTRRRRALHQRTAPGPIPREALEVLRGKRLQVSDHWTDVWREEHATAFTVARMANEELLEEVHGALVAALESGETMESFRARAMALIERRGWSPPSRGGDVPTRLARIYRTNMRTARAAGRWARIERRAQRMPYLVYRRSTAAEPRDAHLPYVGTILPVGDVWWDTHYPPNGWGCLCSVRQVTARERDRLLAEEGYSDHAPDLPMVEWTNPKTGVRRQVPEGIDPGWDFNPGRHRTLGIHRADAERSEALLAGREMPAVRPAERERLVRRRIETSLEGPGFAWFVGRPRSQGRPPRREARDEHVEAVPVAVAPQAIRERADIPETRLLYLPLYIADHQWRQHGPRGRRGPKGRVPVGWYADIQAILDRVTPYRTVVHVNDRGTVVRKEHATKTETRWVYEVRVSGQLRRLAVKRDGAGRLIMVSYYPKQRKQPRTERVRGQ